MQSREKQSIHFKVPRLYKAAAKVAHSVKEENASLQEMVERYRKTTNAKALVALVTKTLDNEEILNRVIQESEILVKETDAEPWLFRILIAELLLGKQRLPVGNKAIQTILAYGPVLKTEFMKAKRRQNNEMNENAPSFETYEEDDSPSFETDEEDEKETSSILKRKRNVGSTQNEDGALSSDKKDQERQKIKKRIKSKNFSRGATN